MEWVETIGKTIEEAKEKALDQLGVHESDAEFELLDEPKQGLFGRVRGEARVRARVRPTLARQKVDRRDRRRERGDKSERADKGERGEKKGPAEKGSGRAASSDNGAPAAPKSPRQPKAAAGQGRAAPGSGEKGSGEKGPAGGRESTRPARAEKTAEQKEQMVDPRQVGEEAQRFLEALVGSFGLTGTVELVEDGDDLELRVHGQELGLLVGPRGTTLQAVQDLTRVASQRRLGDHDTRLRVDVGGYRERRRAALGTFALQMADEVKSSGVARVLEPMSSADRKIIHDALAELDGIATRSEGDDPYRRVVIAPANG